MIVFSCTLVSFICKTRTLSGVSEHQGFASRYCVFLWHFKATAPNWQRPCIEGSTELTPFLGRHRQQQSNFSFTRAQLDDINAFARLVSQRPVSPPSCITAMPRPIHHGGRPHGSWTMEPHFLLTSHFLNVYHFPRSLAAGEGSICNFR